MKTRRGVYQHYKSDWYTVLGVIDNSTNGPDEGKAMVLYFSHEHGTFHVREQKQFNEEGLVGEKGTPERRLSFRFRYSHPAIASTRPTILDWAAIPEELVNG